MAKSWQVFVTVPLLSLAIGMLLGAVLRDDWHVRWWSCSPTENSTADLNNDFGKAAQRTLPRNNSTASFLIQQCTEQSLLFNIWNTKKNTVHHVSLPLFLITMVSMSFSILFGVFAIACSVVTRLRSVFLMDKWSCQQDYLASVLRYHRDANAWVVSR
ncbi:unnamed protein product [Soboliphyme baturini]|uniref:Transmembrane protein n=1 Tax=Soboliphyme baturini TaxID=241478 RepID=A0A183IPK1_9BILA|nr:unnamed protein product [Soboliphyme baturini]